MRIINQQKLWEVLCEIYKNCGVNLCVVFALAKPSKTILQKKLLPSLAYVSMLLNPDSNGGAF